MAEGRKLKKISPQHKAFCETYLKDFNATRAYMAIYPDTKETSASTLGNNLLRNVLIKAYLEQRVAERDKALKLDQTYIIEKLKEIVESDYTGTIQYLTRDQIEKISVDQKKLIQSIQVTKTRQSFDHGKNESESVVYKVTFMDKDKAINALAKHTGIFFKDNEQKGQALGKGFAAGLDELDI